LLKEKHTAVLFSGGEGFRQNFVNQKLLTQWAKFVYFNVCVTVKLEIYAYFSLCCFCLLAGVPAFRDDPADGAIHPRIPGVPRG
jgi:hypothetical protein